MIETKDLNIDGVLHAAQKQSVDKATPTFVSVTEQITWIDPIHFFQAGQQLQENRIFWSSSDQSTQFVGIGDSILFQNKDASYQMLKKEWEQALNNSWIDNRFDQYKTGPIAFGGFPFDPKEKVNELWNGFEGSQFRVPTFLLTVENDKAFLTTTIYVEEDSHIDELSADLITKRHQLLHAPNTSFQNNTIVLKHEVDPLQWKGLVAKATDTIEREEVNKIVLARELQVEFDDDCDIGQVLTTLKHTQNHSFIFAWEKDNVCFIGATPERLVKVDNQQLFSTCLAGTAPRGTTIEEDKWYGQQLLNDQKNRDEHQFVVDMIKNAVHSCAKYVDIPNEPILYPLKNLQHLYTPVEAELDKGYTLLDVVEKLHPTPALCGFPRESSLAFIREFELLERGWYGAPIGWFDQHFNGGEFAVAIRSALISDMKASLFAGCGVVKESDPDIEYQETNIKFTPPMLQALGGSL
ncbi:menaquinone-specific isochorismate synthase [Gracilibacillus boraciitolerans JCM 21714]|uniref:isochorismate synthase n=1 Tax=Gracilibacillus boraciitolerans JCM 21714 TaxID=1298598 RepID=W4VLJ6_9BACI|nr:isochorismate synthase [Gracilibacillus boraciitolerans]GAE94021.1 menaquinone-specific isochorismate synthase [Gracilibacillus boraciitolerans JCM 21714]